MKMWAILDGYNKQTWYPTTRVPRLYETKQAAEHGMLYSDLAGTKARIVEVEVTITTMIAIPKQISVLED